MSSRGELSPRLSSRVASALKRGVSQTWDELDIDLNQSRPGDRRPEASQLVDGSGPMRIVQLRACISTAAVYLADPI